MEESQWINFQNNYIYEMIQAERELEKQIFYDNMSPTEKHLHRWAKEISDQMAQDMAKEIDRQIINDLFKLTRNGDTFNINTIVWPVVQTINIDFTISPKGVTFDP